MYFRSTGRIARSLVYSGTMMWLHFSAVLVSKCVKEADFCSKTVKENRIFKNFSTWDLSIVGNDNCFYIESKNELHKFTENLMQF